MESLNIFDYTAFVVLVFAALVWAAYRMFFPHRDDYRDDDDF